MIVAGKDIKIVDKVTLDGLEAGTKYKLSGWQMLKSGEPGKCKRIWQVAREVKIWYDYGQDIRRIRS